MKETCKKIGTNISLNMCPKMAAFEWKKQLFLNYEEKTKLKLRAKGDDS